MLLGTSSPEYKRFLLEAERSGLEAELGIELATYRRKEAVKLLLMAIRTRIRREHAVILKGIRRKHKYSREDEMNARADRWCGQ